MKIEIPFGEVRICEFFEMKSERKPVEFPEADTAFLHCQAMKIRSVYEYRSHGDPFWVNTVIVKIFEDRPTTHIRKTELGELQRCDDKKMVIVDRPPASGS